MHRGRKALACLLSFVLLFSILINAVAQPTDMEQQDFAGDQSTLTSPDENTTLCSLQTTYLVLTNPTATESWQAKIACIMGSDVQMTEITSDTRSYAVQVGPFGVGRSPLYCIAEIDGTVLLDLDEGIQDFDFDTQVVQFNAIIEPIYGADIAWRVPNAAQPLTIEFEATAEIHMHSGDPCAGEMTYAWDFGDGSTETTNTSTVSHTYGEAPGGKYIASVTVSGEHGGSSSASVTVLAEHPVQAPAHVCMLEGIPVTFINKAFDGTEWTATYSVNGGDAQTATFNTRIGSIAVAAFKNLLLNSDVGKSKDITILLQKIDDETVDYDVTVKVYHWLRALDRYVFQQCFDDPFSFEFTPKIVTHCDCDPIVAYAWTIETSDGTKTATVRNPIVTSTAPILTVSEATLELKTQSGEDFTTTDSMRGGATVGFKENVNPLLLLSNSVICKYETLQLSITNRNSAGPWSIEIADNQSDWTYAQQDIDVPNIVIPVAWDGDPALGVHKLTATLTHADEEVDQAVAEVRVVKAVTADFIPIVTPDNLEVDFVAFVDLHHPTTGGDDCAGIGTGSGGKTYEWIFDTGMQPVGATKLTVKNLYPSAGTKTVTFDVYDKNNEIADRVTKEIDISGERARESFDIIYLAGTSDTVSNMPEDQTADEDDVFTVSDKVPARYGHSFKGWLSSFDEAVYQPLDTFTMPAKNVALSAQWAEKAGPTDPEPDPEPEPTPEPTPEPEGPGSGVDPDNPHDTIVIIGEPELPLFNLQLNEHVRYLNGFVDLSVQPEKSISRGEVAAIFYRLLTEKDKKPDMPQAFPDVSADMWCSPHINCLAALGVITGYPDGTFRPEEPITRAEFAVISSRFDLMYSTTGTAFMDVPEDHWAVQFINSGYINRWLTGYEDYGFRPDKDITRAEAVKIINTILDRLPKELPDDINPYHDIDASHWAYRHIMEASIAHTHDRDEDENEIWIEHYPRDDGMI